MNNLICEKCGKQDKTVKFYEGFAVGVKLCKGTCDKEYLAEMLKKSVEMSEALGVSEVPEDVVKIKQAKRKSLKIDIEQFIKQKIRS